MLFAQVDPVSGLAGWITAAGTVGLLAPVLYWLCYVHLPAKDKQILELLNMHSVEQEKDRLARHQSSDEFKRAVAEQRVEHTKDLDRHEQRTQQMIAVLKAESAEVRKEFRESLKEIITHCERESTRNVDAFRLELESFRNEIAKISNRKD